MLYPILFNLKLRAYPSIYPFIWFIIYELLIIWSVTSNYAANNPKNILAENKFLLSLMVITIGKVTSTSHWLYVPALI